MAHEKPARRRVDQRGRRSRTLYRNLTNANAEYLMVREGAENDLLVRQCALLCTLQHIVMQLSGVNSSN